MKIAVIAHAHFAIRQPYVGGLETHTHQMVKELIAQGHEVTLFAKAGSDRLCTVVPIFWGNSHDGKHPLYNNAYQLAMFRIATGNFDLIINNSLNHIPLQLHDTSYPPMITIFHTPPVLTKMIRSLAKSPTPGNRSYIAVSDLTARQWQPYVAEQITTVSNGLNLDLWEAQLETFKQQSAIWMGRITPEKGTHIALQACIKLGIPVTVGGSIYDKNYYKKQIKPLLDNDLVTYVGHINQDEINQYYKRSSVALVTPVWDEPFGLVAIEALASGTPVAALPNGALPSIITPQVGALAQSDSIDDFAVAINRAMTCSREDCRAYVEQNYTLDEMVRQYVSLAPDPALDLIEAFTWQTLR